LISRSNIKVFLDANIFFAATKSTSGGSHLIINLATQKKVDITTTRYILYEAEQNIIKKLDEKSLNQYYQMLLDSSPRIQYITQTTFREIEALEKVLPFKDIPVFLGMIYSKSKFFITLDKKHFLSNEKLQLLFPKVNILNPGEFLKYYIDHYTD